MPKEMEQKLKRQAASKGYTGKRADRYVYGTMIEKTSWRPHHNKKAKSCK